MDDLVRIEGCGEGQRDMRHVVFSFERGYGDTGMHQVEMSVEELARDCEVQVFRATGPGGQGVNTTDSAVRMKHIPSGITETARESRSQFQNRSSCLRKLRAELERRGRPPRRRVKTKVPQRSRQRRLNDKHFNAIKKANRRKPGSDE